MQWRVHEHLERGSTTMGNLRHDAHSRRIGRGESPGRIRTATGLVLQPDWDVALRCDEGSTLRNSPVQCLTVVEPRRAPNLLLCDHRGSGMASRLATLSDEGWQMDVSDSVRHSLERLAGTTPDALVLDPLVEGGAAEIEALDRAGAEPVPLLLFADPSHIEEAAAVWSSISGRVVDIAHRDAAPLEIMVRLERLADACATRAELRELRHRAIYDDRTELLRPEAFGRRLVEHWSAAERHRHQLALVIADLDRFGRINKVYDHTLGDSVLTHVGEAIRSALRIEDVAGRLGGDEFGFVLPYTERADAEHVVERLRERIRSVSTKFSDLGLEISVSLGFETFDGRDMPSILDLRSHAESALREAKRLGGNRAVYYRSLAPAA